MTEKPAYDELKKRIVVLEEAERELKRANEELAHVLSMSLDMICIADISTATFIKINQTFIDTLGFSEEKLLGRPFLEFVHPDDVDATRQTVEKILLQGINVTDFENRYQCRDGSYRWLSWVSHPDPEKGVTYAVARDITERKQSEDALRKSEALLKEAQRMALIGHWELDPMIGTPVWSEEIFHIFGLDPDKGEPSFTVHETLVHPEDWPVLNQAVNRAGKDGTPFDIVFRIVKPGNEIRWIHGIGTTSMDQRGKVAKLFGTAQDVTDLKEAENALRASEEKYRLLAENTEDVIFTLDRNLTYTYVSPAVKALRGFDPGEVIGQRIEQTLSPGSFSLVSRAISQELAIKKQRDPGPRPARVFELEMNRKDGSKVWTEVKASPLRDEKGNTTGIIGVTRDISDRKRAQDALRESEARLRTIFNTSSDAILVFDSDGALVMTNPAAANMYGYGEAEMIGLTGKDIVHPHCHHRFSAFIKECSETGSFQTESVDVRKDGTRFSVEVHGSLFEYRGNQHLLAVVRDITARKEAEAALRQSEAKYRSIYDNAQAAIFRTRLSDGKVLECNDRFARTYGYDSREECMADFITADHYVDSGTRERMLAQLMEAGEVNDFEARFYRKDGSIVYTRFSARAYPEAGFLEGVGYDITREKDAQEELRVSEEKYRTILESMTEGYYEVDIAGNLTFFNHSLCDILGYAEDELMGVNYRKYTTEESAKEVYEAFNRVYVTGAPAKGFDWEVIRKDGTRRSIEVSVSPRRDAQDAVAGFSGIVRDITEKRMLEFNLRRAQKMEALGLLAGGVAHDLNNILSGIVSYPELILMDLPEESPLRKPLHTIQESGMRAADVVADLLTIARGVATSKENLNLNTIVSEYLGSAEHHRIEKTHPFVRFKSELEPALLNTRGSPTHLKKTLMNLVTNASEAIEGAGTVTLSTFNRYLDKPIKGYHEFQPGEYAVFAVSDDGPGIPAKDLERIFEPFYTKKVMGRSGTGLGLSVVWNTVQDHNGYIHVTTSEKGARFELYFPVTKEQVAHKRQPVDVNTFRGHGERILVVDDEESQREIAVGMLTRLGYDAEAVSSGEAAIAYVKEHPVDLIVLDMVMPRGINGRETYEEIIRIRPGQKAIIASGYSRTTEVETAQKVGAGNYLKKPYVLEKMGAAVKEELQRQAPLDLS